MRPAINTAVVVEQTGERATVVPTGKHVPEDEVNVMLDSGSIRTVPVASLVER